MSTDATALISTAAHPAEAPGTNLTDRQLLVWLDHQVGGGAPSNNMVAMFRIGADVEATRFQRAFRTVVSESDALRTIFETIAGSPWQRVRPEVPRETELVDLSSAPDRERALRLWSDERRQRAFQLDACAYDSVLVRLGPSDQVWYLCVHHLITDGWSFSLVYERTLRAYLGETSPPPPPFAEQVEHAARYRASKDHARSEAFWRRRTSEALPDVRFYGGDRASRGSYFDRREVVLDPEKSAALSAAASRLARGPRDAKTASDAALAAAVMSLVVAYVHRVSGNRAIGIGCPFVNRPGKRARETIGPFLEVCPLRIELDEDETFHGLIEKTRRDLLAILPHARHAAPNPTGHRAFEVLVNFHTARFAPLLGPTRTSLSTGVVGLDPESPRIVTSLAPAEGENLRVSVHDFDGTGRLTFTFDLREGVFDEKTRERAPGHFLRLLDAFIADPERAIARVALIDDEERSELLGFHGAFDTSREHPTLVELFEAQVRACPDRIAVRHGEEEIDYRRLSTRVHALARRLRRSGIAPGDRVAVRLDRSIDMVVAILATLRARGAYVPLDPTHPEARVGQILEDARPILLLTSTALRATLVRPELDVICIDEGSGEEPSDAEEALPFPEPDQLGYLVFTSGSTGRPKGVEISHRALASHFRAVIHAPGFREGEHMIALTTVTFDIAALELLMPLTVGSWVEIVDRATATDGAALSALLHERRKCFAFATPGTWRMLVESGWKGCPGMRLLVGGEVLPLDLAEALSVRVGELWNVYGPTETTILSTIQRVPPSTDRPMLSAVPIGRPMDNTCAYVLGADRALLPLGVTGELYIGGEGVARGYCGRPDLTEERFLPDPFSPRPSARMYRTGDLASFCAEGVLRYHGRVDRQIKLRGSRIEPGDIEAVLRTHAGVSDAVVMVREVSGDPRLVAYVVSTCAPSAKELRAYASARLPHYMVPAYFVSLPSLPRTSSGKTDQLALPPPSETSAHAAARDADAELAFEPPTTKRERELAAIWQELLGATRIGRHDDFFALGGHSLLAVRVANRIRRDLGTELSIRALFEHPTLAGLAAAIGHDSAGPALVPLTPEGPGTPIFFICGIHLYQELATRIGDDQPSYAVFIAAEEELSDARRAHRKTPELSVLELASEYLGVVRARQPHGPYRLAGISFGGVLAYEIAQRLRELGEEVELLAILDAILPRALIRSPIRSALERVRTLAFGPRPRIPTEQEGERERELNDLRLAVYMRALEAHEPRLRSYPGPVLLFRALDRSETHGSLEVDPWCGWRELLEGELHVIDVPGDHLGILRAPAVEVVAAAIRARLASAAARAR